MHIGDRNGGRGTERGQEGEGGVQTVKEENEDKPWKTEPGKRESKEKVRWNMGPGKFLLPSRTGVYSAPLLCSPGYRWGADRQREKN